MKIVVQKYGGSSVGDLKKIALVALHVKNSLVGGKKIIVVASAMGKTTNHLISQARQLAKKPDTREMDQLLSVGETQSVAFLTIKLIDLGVKAKSLTAKQIGLLTSNSHENARILGLESNELVRDYLEEFDVLVVTGFQGTIQGTDEITTVGRGGSDAIAVALAVEMEAEICEIYTDVDGVFFTNPNIVQGAKKFKTITPGTMMKMFKAGAKVMMGRSVQIGQDFDMPIRVMLSPSFGKTDGGTLITRQTRTDIESTNAENFASLGIREVAAVTISNIPNKPGMAAEIFSAIKTNVIEAVQPLVDSNAFITIYLEAEHVDTVVKDLQSLQSSNSELHDIAITGFHDLVALTLIDEQMIDGPGYARAMLRCLSACGINIYSIYTAEENLGVIIKKEFLQAAAEAIAKEFCLIE